MKIDTPRRLCLALGSLALLIAVGFGDRMPDFFRGLLEGLALALMLAFLVLTGLLKKQRRSGNGGDRQ